MKRYLILVCATLLLASYTFTDAGPPMSGGAGSLPSQTGHTGEFLTTNGTAASWSATGAGIGDFLANGSVAMTGAIVPNSVGGQTIGTAALPFSSVYIGNQATNNIQLTGTAASAKVVTLPGQTGTVTVSPTTTTAGQILQGTTTAGLGAFSTATYPLTAGTARKMLVSDGTNIVSSTELWPIATTSGNIMVADGTNWVTTASTGTGAPVRAGSPTFTGDVILPSSNADPAATAGALRHDSTVTNFTGGALRYYNGSAIKQVIDMTAATAEGCTDDYVVAYDADADLWYCKADATGGGTTMANDAMWAAKGDLAVASANDTGGILSHPGAANYALLTNAADTMAWTAAPVFGTSVEAPFLILGSAATAADAGAIRMPNATSIAWEYPGGTGTDTTLTVDASDDMVAALVAATDLFKITTGNLFIGAGTPTQAQDGADAYITGMLEVDGMIYADGGVTGALTGNASTATSAAGLTGTPNITVGTVSAGAAGFSVDADGDATAKSITITRTASADQFITLFERTGVSDRSITLTATTAVAAPVWSATTYTGMDFGALNLLGTGYIALGADPADAGAIRLSNAGYIYSEASPAGTDISVIGVDSGEIIQIGASGASGVTITPHLTVEGVTSTGATGTGALVFGTAPQISTIELGAASDTTVARVSAGVVSVEGLTLPRIIASGATALDFGSTATGACATVIQAAATNAATTDVIIFNPNASIKAVTGYVPASTGGFSITAFPTSGYVNFEACNWTAGTVDPGSITVNWMVIR
jgi:hypothetical protein